MDSFVEVKLQIKFSFVYEQFKMSDPFLVGTTRHIVPLVFIWTISSFDPNFYHLNDIMYMHIVQNTYYLMMRNDFQTRIRKYLKLIMFENKFYLYVYSNLKIIQFG